MLKMIWYIIYSRSAVQEILESLLACRFDKCDRWEDISRYSLELFNISVEFVGSSKVGETELLYEIF